MSDESTSPLTLRRLFQRYQAGGRDFRGVTVVPDAAPSSQIGEAEDFELQRPLESFPRDLSYADFSRARLDGIDLSQTRLLSVAMVSTWLLRVRFEGAEFTSSDLTSMAAKDCVFDNASFNGATLGGAVSFISQCSFVAADFRGASTLRGAKFTACRMSGALLDGVEAENASFSECDLSHAQLKGARLIEAMFDNCNLSGADLSDAQMHKADLRRANLMDATLRNCRLNRAVLQNAVLVAADLTSASLPGVYASEANFRLARLHAADFYRAELRLSNLSGCDLTDANLAEADLWGASLDDANLSRTDFSGANLEKSTLRPSQVDGARFLGAYLWGARVELDSPHEGTLEGAIRDTWKRLEPPGLEGRIMFSDRLEEEPTHTVVRVFFATDRADAGRDVPESERFGAARGSHVSYGTCEVSLPRDHRMGRLEAPSIWRLELRWDERRHVLLRSVKVTPSKRFFESVGSRSRHSVAGEALVFLHGFNVTFADAIRRTAQLSYDLAFDGAPLVYSWTSQGRASRYIVDETNARLATDDFIKFLSSLLSVRGVRRIHLVAHSMGARVLFDGLQEHLLYRDRSRVDSRVGNVFLTAPDIDAETFTREVVKVYPAGDTLTLYASAKDRALALSKSIHGYPRAGDAGTQLITMPGLVTIDATEVDTDFLAQSYFGSCRSVISDLFYAIRDVPPEERHGLRKAGQPPRQHWSIVP
jgi:esterase/lipase superfamily enzyme/uncharacterized protein YjbI with pentapeptide repeats